MKPKPETPNPLKPELDRMTAKYAEAVKSGDDLMRERNRDVSRLKGELQAANLTIARLQGYVQRALEDDAVREVGATIDPPKDPAPPILRRQPPHSDIFHPVSREALVYGMRAERDSKEWFDL